MPTRLLLVTPDTTGRYGGNRVTASRQARRLREAGYSVRLSVGADDGRPADALLALHARHGADACRDFAARLPDAPIVVTLTGTDLYRDLGRSAAVARTLEGAAALIVLQPAARRRLPAHLRRRAHVIHQSIDPPSGAFRPRRVVEGVQVAVIGHLRPVKDPLRVALAVRHVPRDSRLSVVQVGDGLDDRLAARARAEQGRQSRYRWLGERTPASTAAILAGSDVLVLPSRSEGGANVIGEACCFGVPILASRIDGNVGLLGARHPGLFDVGDTAGLRRLLLRFEADAGLRRRLAAASRALAPLFEPARERAALAALFAGLLDRRGAQGMQVRKPAKTSRRSGP